MLITRNGGHKVYEISFYAVGGISFESLETYLNISLETRLVITNIELKVSHQILIAF